MTIEVRREIAIYDDIVVLNVEEGYRMNSQKVGGSWAPSADLPLVMCRHDSVDGVC